MGRRREILEKAGAAHLFPNACPVCPHETYVTARLVLEHNVSSEREPFCRTHAELLDERGLLAVRSARRIL